MSIKLIALDLDGTLNNDQKQITSKTRAALIEAQQLHRSPVQETICRLQQKG